MDHHAQGRPQRESGPHPSFSSAVFPAPQALTQHSNAPVLEGPVFTPLGLRSEQTRGENPLTWVTQVSSRSCGT